MTFSTKQFISLSLFIFSLFTLTSCLKEKELEPASTSALHLINTLTNPDSIHVFFDRQAITGNTRIGFAEQTEMIVFQSGNHEILISAGTANNALSNISYDYLKDNFYTLFSTNTSTGTSLIVKADSLNQREATKAKVRFAHMSYDAPRINVSANEADMFSNVAFKTVTSFKDVNPGIYTITIDDPESGDAKISKSFTLAADKIYTIWCGGSWDSESGKTAYSLHISEY